MSINWYGSIPLALHALKLISSTTATRSHMARELNFTRIHVLCVWLERPERAILARDIYMPLIYVQIYFLYVRYIPPSWFVVSVMDNPNVFPTGSKPLSLFTLFMGRANQKLLSSNINGDVNLTSTMGKFAVELEIADSSTNHSAGGNIQESLDFLNQLYLDNYGSSSKQNEIYQSSFGKYPKASLSDPLDYNDVYAFRSYDAQFDQQTMRSNANFRDNNKIPRYQQTGHALRMASENTGLRLGDFQEAESINRGYAMETILATNRYNTKPNYGFDTLLSNTDRLQ